MNDKQTDWLSRKNAPSLAIQIRDYWWSHHRLIVDTTITREPHGQDEIWVIRSNIPGCFNG